MGDDGAWPGGEGAAGGDELLHKQEKNTGSQKNGCERENDQRRRRAGGDRQEEVMSWRETNTTPLLVCQDKDNTSGGRDENTET